MYKFEDALFTENDVIQRAQEKGMTMDEYLSQNPEIIKVDEGKENDTATTDTAPVSDTVSTLENGSLESQDPSKAFAAYTLQTNPSQQQISDVNSLFSDMSIFDIQEKKEAVFNPKSDKFTYKTSKVLPYEDLLTKIQEDLGPEANKDQVAEKALEKLKSDELAKIKKQNQVDFLESLEDGEIPPLTAEYWKKVGQLPLDPSKLKQYITKGGEKYNKDYSIALDNVYNVVEQSNSLIEDLNKYNDKFESGEQITQEEQEDYLTKYNSLNSLQEDYNEATNDLGYYAIDIKDSSAQLALLKKNYDDLEKFGVSTLLAFKDFGAKAAYGLSVKLEPESRNLLRTLQLKEVLDNSNAIRQKYSEDVSFDDAFKDITSFGKYSHQLLANQLPILASLSIPGGWTALLESSFGDRYKEMSIEDLNKKDFNEEERTKLKKFVEAYSYAIPEVVLDRLTTGVRLKTIGQAFTGPERELFKRSFTESLQRGAFDTTVDSAAGGFSEGLTQVIQNKITGKPIMEGVAEATFSGVYFDGVLSSVPAIKGMVMSSLSDVDAYKEVRYIQGKIESLEALQKSDNVKRNYSNDIKQLKEQRDSKIRKIEAEIKGTDGNLGMSVSASDLYVKTTAAQESIRKQAQDIVNSKLSQAKKDSELKQLKLQFDFLESNRKSYLKEKGSGYVLLDQENKQKYIDKALKRAKDKNTVIKDGEIDGLARQEYDREDIENNLKAAKKNNLDDTIEVIRSEEEFNDFVNKNVDKINDKQKLDFTNAYKNGENGFAFDNKSVLLVENMAVNGRTKVRTHELFHILGSKAFNNDNTIFNGIANSIVEWTKANDEIAYNRLQRLVERKDGKLIADEVIAVFMEDVANNRIKLNNKKGLLSLLGFGTSKALKDAYGLNVDPAGIDDTVNLIYGIAKKIDAGTLTETDIEKLSGLEQSEALQKQGKRAVEDYMFATGEDFKKASKVQSKIDDLGNKYTRDEWVESGADETIGEIYTDLEGLISSKAFMLDRLPNFSKEDFITETLVQLIPHIRNFNIDKRKDQSDKFGLSGWINSQLMNKIGNVLKAKTATTETFSVDESADTFREIVATEDDLDLLEDEDLSLQAQLRKKQRDQKRAEKGLQVGVEYSKFRRELEINGQKGISDAMKNKVEDITLEILTSNKYINLNLDAVQKTLQRDFEVAIKKTIQDAMGGQNDYVQFLTRNMNTILRHMDISSLVAIERQVDSKDKIMTEFVRRLQTQKDVQDAIDNGWLSHIDNPAQGPNLYKVLKPSVADFIKFYSPSLRVESPKKVKQWNTMTDVAKQQFADGIGKTLEQARRQFVEVRSGLKGTRKDTLAERIAGQLAFDATMQVIQGNEFASLRAVQGKPVLAQGRIKEIARRIDRGIEVKFAKKGKMVTVTSGMINISSDLINDAVNRKSTIANEDSIDRTKYKYFEFNTEKGDEYFNTAVDIAQGILNDFRYESMSIKEDYRDEAIKKAIENNVQVFNNKKGKYKTANYMAEQMVIDGINPYFKNNQNVEIQPEPSGPTGVDIIIRHKKKDLELYYGLEKKMTTARGPVTSIQPVIENGKLNFYTGKKNPVLFDPNSIAVNPEDASQIEAMMQAAREKINALNSLFKSEGLPEFVDSYVDLTFAQIEAIATKSHKAFFNVGGLKSDNFMLSQDWLTQKYDNKKQKTSAIDIGTSGLKFLPSKNSTVTVMNNTVKRIFKEKTGIEIPTLNESMKAQMKFMVSTKGKITFVLEQKIEGNSMSASPAQLSKKSHRKAFAEATSTALNQQAIGKVAKVKVKSEKPKFVEQAKMRFSKKNIDVFKQIEVYKKFENALKGLKLYHGGDKIINKLPNVKNDEHLTWFFVEDAEGAYMHSESFRNQATNRSKGVLNIIKENKVPVHKVNFNSISQDHVVLPDFEYEMNDVVRDIYYKVYPEKDVRPTSYDTFSVERIVSDPKALEIIEEILKASFKTSEFFENGKIVEGAPVVVLGLIQNNKRERALFPKGLLTYDLEKSAFPIESYGGLKFAKSMNQSINEMINRSRGIPTDEVVSAAIAKRRGKNKNRFQVYIPPSAEDFVGLMYFIIGKGKQGDADLDFIKKSLIEPFSEAYTNLDSVRQAILTDIQALNKQLPELKKKLNDTMPNSEFTFDNAIRVYLYNKHGHNVPGISTEENSNLVSRVLADEELLVYAESLDLFSKTEAWLEPGEYWTAGSTVSDINRIVEGFHRKEFLKDWIENKDEIFSKDNMNKLEAAYGSNYRSALEDMLYRMETGVSRPSGKNKINNQFTNWLNNSVGAIMFFNVKSALLQTLSTVNYLNFEDNNIFAAGKAFANQPQYWSDFTMIFNSDFLKNRRSGIKTDVSLSEIASNVAQAGNKAKAAMAYLLKVGFTPTQIADSFAIASGGSTYYRNRVNKYIKEGKSKTEAEKQAFIDFREVTEETQQSARPDRVSQQQTSDAGRLILAFQNAPMQFNRIIKKAALDLANNRGDYRANISRIVYYGGIQSLIFTAMQNALFALAFDDEDESKLTAKEIEKKQKFETKKYERIVNSMIDTILRGSGIAGAVIATIKNTSIKFITEDEGVLVEALQLSPQIGSKARKILKGKRSFKWDGEAIGLMSKFDTKNPIWAISTPIIEATTNVPLNRLLNKVNNLREATDSTNSAWQRAAMALGWSAWDLGVDPSTEVKEAIKKGKEQGLIKGKGTAKSCLAVKSDGTPCRNMTTNKNRLCYLHD